MFIIFMWNCNYINMFISCKPIYAIASFFFKYFYSCDIISQEKHDVLQRATG